MGIGHYHVRDGRTVILEPYDGLPDFDESIRWQWDDAWQDMKETIRDCLSPRFDWKARNNRWRNDAHILAQSRLHDITLHEDSYGYAYVTVRPRDDLDSAWEYLAAGNLDSVADRLFAKLALAYDLRVGSGYTSSPYVPA